MSKILSFDEAIQPSEKAGVKGVLALANENRFEAANYSEPLTQFIAGVMGTDLAGLQAELDRIAPPVRTARRFEYKKAPAGLSFLADLEDERAIGADFRKVDAGGESVQAKTANRGLSITLDRDEMVDGSIEQAAKWLTAILMRNDIRRAFTAITAAATNTNKTWNASANPDGDLRDMLISVLTSRGLMPNLLLAGSAAWSIRASSYEASTKAGALALASYSPAQLADKLGVETVHVSKTVYKATKSGSKALALGSYMIALYTDAVVSKEDGSNVKRFWTPCEGGQQFRVYVDQSKAKTVEVVVEQYSSVAVTDSTGINMYTVAAS